jgi:hypothetical protein
MQDNTNKKRSRAAKLIGGALVGTVLSIGAVSGSASASTSAVKSNTSTLSSLTSQSSGYTQSYSRFGIRW